MGKRLTGKGHELWGGIASYHRGGISVKAYSLRQRAGATANFKPGPRSGRGEPIDELFGNQPTPPAHKVLICVANNPLIGHFNQGSYLYALSFD
jgi:hypothetical protein